MRQVTPHVAILGRCRLSAPTGMGDAEMTVFVNKDSKVGIVLAERLGLTSNKPEGHCLAGTCISCNSSDAFRLH